MIYLYTFTLKRRSPSVAGAGTVGGGIVAGREETPSTASITRPASPSREGESGPRGPLERAMKGAYLWKRSIKSCN
jgi:hypothetical protein